MLGGSEAVKLESVEAVVASRYAPCALREISHRGHRGTGGLGF
jgi:hypothetical protein